MGIEHGANLKIWIEHGDSAPSTLEDGNPVVALDLHQGLHRVHGHQHNAERGRGARRKHRFDCGRRVLQRVHVLEQRHDSYITRQRWCGLGWRHVS